MMKIIKVCFTDFPGPFNPTRIRSLLKNRFEIVIDNENPDYVIYSVSGYNHLRYPNAIKIFFTGENIRPDFNLCDYAFGYDWLEFGDRHYRCPNYQLYDQFKELCTRRRSKMAVADISSVKKGFCNFIYTAGGGHPFRDQFFHRLNEYRIVDSPGAHLRNIKVDIGPAYQGDWSASKVEFQRNYKFSIAFENSTTVGYTTEKLVHALAADTIPIYWGNPEVGREFNTRRFINCHEYHSVETIVRRITEIDQSDNLFLEILTEPFFPNDKVLDSLRDERVLDQFDRIFAQQKQNAFRRSLYAWGAHYERQRRAETEALTFVEGNGILQGVARMLKRLA